MSQIATVSLSELVDAVDFVSLSDMSEFRAYICTATGTIYYISDDPKLNQDNPADLEESEQYISVPSKRDLDLGRAVVNHFVDRELPDEWDTVRDFFRRRGAWRRFKDFLESRGLLEKWYRFEEQSAAEAVRAWCEDNEIPLSKP
jgi:hypothetical protein